MTIISSQASSARAQSWMRRLAILLGLAAPLLAGLPSRAHPLADFTAQRVVPEKERQAVSTTSVDAPKQSQGILSVRDLGHQPLDTDFPSMEGYQLRLREITVAPGGHIGLHRHEHRPGLAYMLEGVMVERRGPSFKPRPLHPGEAVFEGTGVIHWWKNSRDKPARALVVDVVPEESP